MGLFDPFIFHRRITRPIKMCVFNNMTFAPYIDVTSYPLFDINRGPDLNSYSLGFITASVDNHPCWGGYYDVTSNYYRSIIETAHSKGKNLICSFGGASGRELATVLNDDKLYKAYKQVIDTYNFKKLDFDIEGGALGNIKANINRGKVINKLMTEYGLEISVTVPVSHDGLDNDALNLIKVTPCSLVNIMAMDYGNGFNKMGEFAISAAKAARAQTGKDIGITVMIGKNDVLGEIFTLDDARKVKAFSKATPWIKRLSIWSLNRDTGLKGSLDLSSQIAQRPWEFSSIFK